MLKFVLAYAEIYAWFLVWSKSKKTGINTKNHFILCGIQTIFVKQNLLCRLKIISTKKLNTSVNFSHIYKF